MKGQGRFAILSSLEERDGDYEEAPETGYLSSIESSDVASDGNSNFALPEEDTSNSLNGDDPFEPDRLCENCRRIFQVHGHDGIQSHDVKVADAAWCRLCKALLEKWAPESYNTDQFGLNYRFDAREGYFMSVLDIIFEPKVQTTKTTRRARFGFQMDKGKDVGYPEMPRYTVDLPASTRLEDSATLIKKWFKDCESHERCRTPQSDFIPSRLVEISTDAAGSIFIRLKCRSEFDHAVIYATLSHCWGSSVPLKLEESKLHQYQQDIPLSDISQVFRDSIDVTVALGIRYIWIDSLCIIQDSKADWHSESAMMREVYSHCCLNIAADASENGSQGLFREREAALLKPIQVVMREDNPPPQNYTRFSAMEPGNYLLVDIHAWKDEIDDGPLGKRGWVVQERALSPKTIHFGCTQIAWECLTCAHNEVFQGGFLRGTLRHRLKDYAANMTRQSESAIRTYEQIMRDREQNAKSDAEFMLELAKSINSHADGSNTPSESDFDGDWAVVGRNSTTKTLDIPSNIEPSQLVGLDRTLLDQLRLSAAARKKIQKCENLLSPTYLAPPATQHMSDMQRKWCGIVIAYTQCGLSYDSDKLVAIAGMAQMMSQATQCQYLAGLWRKDLEHQLLWKVTTPLPAAVNDATRGPSWSWASVNGAVTWDYWFGGYHTDDIQWLARIEKVQVKPVTNNPFGQVAGGSLILTGPLGVLHIKRERNSGLVNQNSSLAALDHGVDILWDNKELTEHFGRTKQEMVSTYKTYPATRAAGPLPQNDVFFMPLRSLEHDYTNSDYAAPMLQGLLLFPCTKVRGTYRRVGHFTVSEQAHRSAFKNGNKPLQTKTHIVDGKFYQSRRNGEYTIAII